MSLFNLMFRQSWQAKGIWLLLAALILAVTATTSLRFATETISTAIDQQAGQLLAGDLVITSGKPLAQRWYQASQQAGLRSNNATVFGSMAQAGEQFVLVNVKAIESGFPLRGNLSLQPQQPAGQPPQAGTIWLMPRLFDLLNVKIGDDIRIGDASFRVAAAIVRDPNQESGMSGFSPTVIINALDVAATRAVQTGSRIDYRLILAGEPQVVNAFQQQYKSKMGEGVQLRSASQGNTRLMRPVQMLDDYAQIVSVLTMLLCGIAIALSCQRYVTEQLDQFAMLRCVGASRRQLSLLYWGLLLILLAIATVVGTLIGAAIAYGLLEILRQALPALELRFQPVLMLGQPLLTGVLSALVLLAGFALPHILRLIRVSPLRVIRRMDDRIGWVNISIGTAAIGLMLAFLLLQTGKVVLSLILLGGLLLALLLIWGMVYVLLLGWRRYSQFAQAYVRQPQQLSMQIVALALGLGLLTVVLLLRDDLMQRWQHSLPAGTPNQFVYGLPPDQKDVLLARLDAAQWPHSDLFPNVRGRLTGKNGQKFSEELVKQHNSLRRELNLTQADKFPADNKMVAGKPFTAPNQVSVEQKEAAELGIKLGDHITMNLPEGELTAEVVSLRTVNWDSFGPNFFFIYSPQTFDENAGSYLGSFYVTAQQRPQLAQVIRDFPTTVFIDVDVMLNEVRKLLDVLGQALGLLAALVSVAGFLVLLTSLQLTVDERQREVVLLRAIGLSRSQLRRRLGVEMGLIGLLAGIMAVFLAESVSALMSYRLSIPFRLHMTWWLFIPVAMTLLALLVGQNRLRPLWRVSPLLILRRES